MPNKQLFILFHENDILRSLGEHIALIKSLRVYMKNIQKESLWQALKTHAKEVQANTLHQYASSVSSNHITLDYRHQNLTDEGLSLLCSLARSCNLRQKINDLIEGEPVNTSENRPALHTALRAPTHASILVKGHNVMDDIVYARSEMKRISELVRNKLWLGSTGKPITDVVNIGIGGSDLGPRFCLHALSQYITDDLGVHFISDADPANFNRAIKNLNPETTLFIISSKSFTTQETLYNAKKAKSWIGNTNNVQQHFIAVTAHPKKANQFGIKHTLPIWDWVGGRYSFCSAINLISAIAIGYSRFEQLLEGAHSMDQHFKEQDIERNLPVMLALMGIWNNNFLSTHNHLILPYASQLEKFVPFIQQLDMESNGKSIDNQGMPINYATGPIVWGSLGNQAQHSFYQLLCQGTHKITADFITLDIYKGEVINKMADERMLVLREGVQSKENPTNHIKGNMTFNHLRLKDCSPFTIGELVALYEHKIFTQSVIWEINPFDQPGVESAKQYARQTSTLVPA